jgi:hypothetical protein
MRGRVREGASWSLQAMRGIVREGANIRAEYSETLTRRYACDLSRRRGDVKRGREEKERER